MKILKCHHTYLCTYKHAFYRWATLKLASNIKIRTFVLLIFVHAFPLITNGNPPNPRFTVFERAKTLDNGISVSWLEQTWDKDVLNQDNLKDVDFILLKHLGFKSIRLPVAFEFYENSHIPDGQIFSRIDKVIKQCRLYGFKLIIDYHSGNFNENNYLIETKNIIQLWLKLTMRYRHVSSDFLFFELYNEPPHMDPKIWNDAALAIVTAIRRLDNNRTLIIGASNYNSIYELSRSAPITDKNIIYTYHFYEPFLFTHQGAEWVGDQEATTGVPFPYNAEKFPAIDPKAKNTDGEKNYKEYPIDGNERTVGKG